MTVLLLAILLGLGLSLIFDSVLRALTGESPIHWVEFTVAGVLLAYGLLVGAPWTVGFAIGCLLHDLWSWNRDRTDTRLPMGL